MLKILISLLTLLIAAGCTKLGPDYQRPELQLPSTWSNQDTDLFKRPSEQESRAWWTFFNDPVLDELIETAYKENLTLRGAALRIVEARASLGFVEGQLYPQQQEGGGDLFTIGTTGPSEDRYYNSASMGFDVAWEMDFWGKFRRSIESAEAQLSGTNAEYDDILITLTAEVARTYVNIRTLEERIDLAEQNAKLQRDSLELVKLQFEAGMVTELDVLQAKTLLSSTLATVPQLQASLASNKNGLAVLLGTLPEKVDGYLSEKHGIPQFTGKAVVELPAELLRRRPDIRQAEMLAAAQSAQIGIARSELFPSFTLFGSISWSANDRGTNDLGKLFDSNSFGYSFGPAFRWNLFHYGRLKNQVRIQDARFQQLLVNYQNSVLNAAREVEDALQSLEQVRFEAVFLRQAVETSKRSSDLSILQYKEGLADYQRVLDSLRSYTTKQDQYSQAKGKIANSTIALYKAFGGGWQMRSGRSYLPQKTVDEMESRTDWGPMLNPVVIIEDP